MRKVLKSAYEGPLTGDEINKRLREVYSNQVNPIAEPEKVRRALKFDERAKKFKGSKRAKHPEGKKQAKAKIPPKVREYLIASGTIYKENGKARCASCGCELRTWAEVQEHYELETLMTIWRLNKSIPLWLLSREKKVGYIIRECPSLVPRVESYIRRLETEAAIRREAKSIPLR